MVGGFAANSLMRLPSLVFQTVTLPVQSVAITPPPSWLKVTRTGNSFVNSNAFNFSHDGGRVIATDWTGKVTVWNTSEGKRISELAANPPAIAEKMTRVQRPW